MLPVVSLDVGPLCGVGVLVTVGVFVAETTLGVAVGVVAAVGVGVGDTVAVAVGVMGAVVVTVRALFSMTRKVGSLSAITLTA